MIDVFHAFHVVRRFQIFLPELTPVVVVPYDVELVGSRRQRRRGFLHEHAVGHGYPGELHPVRLGPFLHHIERGVLDRILHVADLKLALLRLRAEDAHAKDKRGCSTEHVPHFAGGHLLPPSRYAALPAQPAGRSTRITHL